MIGEIGGSSSRWALLSDHDQVRIIPSGGPALPGFNPLNGDADAFVELLRARLTIEAPEFLQAGSLMVYGAGCGSKERRARMQDTLQRIWPLASIEVDTDIMGAARGLCGGGTGLVLILGTGMNVGWTDGSRLHQPMPSLGYILGDEGSGADIGRMLLQDAFYDRMPADVKLALFGIDGPDREKILMEVYRSPFPAKMLAARTVRLWDLMDRPYVRGSIISRFHVLADLIKKFFTQEQQEQVFATGSVAYGFQELLAEVLMDHGMDLVKVEKDPLHGLIRHASQR